MTTVIKMSHNSLSETKSDIFTAYKHITLILHCLIKYNSQPLFPKCINARLFCSHVQGYCLCQSVSFLYTHHLKKNGISHH